LQSVTEKKKIKCDNCVANLILLTTNYIKSVTADSTHAANCYMADIGTNLRSRNKPVSFKASM